MTNCKILVLDDEHDIADLLKVYLQNENYIAYKFYSATEALACIEQEDFDLAILDIMLPDMNGFSICQKIREKHTYPIIMLTAKDEETDNITGLTLGADDYVTKPFRPLYPFWHDHGLKIDHTELTELSRAALWYSDHIEITESKLHGIKALRECRDILIESCHIISPEFGWSANNTVMRKSSAEGECFFMRSQNLDFSQVTLKGKYSFQYIEDAVFDQGQFDTKDAFWHAKNVTVKDSVIKGEYLAWYSDGLTLVNCKIIGTQPFRYCRNLKLIDCEMTDTDLAFEKSDVEATVLTPVISIKNPRSGSIRVPSVGCLIMDDEEAKASIIALERERKWMGGNDGNKGIYRGNENRVAHNH